MDCRPGTGDRTPWTADRESRQLVLLIRWVMSMRTTLKLVAGVMVAAVAGITGWGQSNVELKVGDVAPGFNLPGSDGKTHQLSDHMGQRAVVLAWFPKAFTGG